MSVVDILVRALLMFAAVLLAFRFLGKRMMAAMTPMDKVAVIAYGTIAGSTTITRTIPLYGGLLAVAAFAVLAWFAGRLSLSSESMRDLLLGSPRPLVEKGQVNMEQLKRAGLSREDLAMRLRELKVASMADVELAQLEPDGKLGLLEKKSAKSSNAESSASGEPDAKSKSPSHTKPAPDHVKASSHQHADKSSERNSTAQRRSKDAQKSPNAEPTTGHAKTSNSHHAKHPTQGAGDEPKRRHSERE